VIEIRSARDSDADGLIRLIGAVFDEYPGCVLDVDGELPELRRIAGWSQEHAGEFFCAERAGTIVGCVGFALAHDAGGIELKKLYVDASERKSGLGGQLLAKIEKRAGELDAKFIDLWSDTRFVTAHAFYEKRGFVRGPVTRPLHDKSHTIEYYFRKELTR